MPRCDSIELFAQQLLVVWRVPQAKHVRGSFSSAEKGRDGSSARREQGQEHGLPGWQEISRESGASYQQKCQNRDGWIDNHAVTHVIAAGKMGVCHSADALAGRQLHRRYVEAHARDYATNDGTSRYEPEDHVHGGIVLTDTAC